MNSIRKVFTSCPDAVRLWEMYCELGSVHKMQEKYNVCHTKAHRVMVSAGYRLNGSKFTLQDDEKITQYYKNTQPEVFDLQELTDRLGRSSKTNVCRRARQLGLTDMARPLADYTKSDASVKWKKWHKENEHPRGMLGKKHTEETKAVIGLKSAAMMQSMSEDEMAQRSLKILKTRAANGNYVNPRPNASWKSGWHEIGGKRHYFRSHWEVNYAYYLEWLKDKKQIVEWEFEPVTFWFDKIKRGTMSYLPDFRITENNGQQVFHEVKGWMDDRSITKLKRMAKYHPEVKLILIDSKSYKELSKKLNGLVPGWS